MTCRLGIFAAICKRSLMVRQVRSKLNHFNALIHSSVIRFDDPIEIKMPSLSPTMTEGTIVKWLKNEGDTIIPGDVICEIQTDKAVVGFEVEEEGVLIKILMPEDSKNIQLGEVIAVIGSEGSTYEAPLKAKTLVDSTPISEKSIPSSKVSSSALDQKAIPKLIGPSVRKLLQEYNINFSLILSSGPQNNILKGDVLSFIDKNKLKPQVSASKDEPISIKMKTPLSNVTDTPFVDIQLTSMRKTIARRLSESKGTIPHAYITIDCCVDQVSKIRKTLKNDGIKVSVNDFVIKSVACALSKVPEVNVINANGRASPQQSIDISVAVATENGLITPIVKNANNLSIQGISDAVRSLAVKAREGKLKIEEFQGGSFTISNLGMFGISEFSAVINPPQGAILAVGSTRLIAEKIQPMQKMNVTLSYDCSIIDERAASQFLQALQSYLENPSSILL